MTTNTNPSRTAARFTATDKPFLGLFQVIDRVDGQALASIKGRAEVRRQAAVLNDNAQLVAEAQPAPMLDADEPATDRVVTRTSHAACEHASTKLARAICRREAAKATTNA